MNPQFTNPPIYAPTSYPLSHQQSVLPSRPQSHGLPQQNLPAPHTLPPLASGHHTTSAYGNDTYPARSQPLQASSLSSPQEQYSQPGSYSVYAPAATAFYHGQNANFPQPSQNLPIRQQTTPVTLNDLGSATYTSAPPTQARLPDLLPMPARGHGRLASAAERHANQLDTGEEPQPTHVVGSQGRRGILPSAAGRPAAVAGASTSGQKAAPTPPKDAEGKYPCPHCTKNYLHAKHLKRHLLRHTGVRPYTCGLCKDTFSRSDILKRHFQKCSVRRGNPSGENHLSHSRANKKSRQEDATRLEGNTPTEVNQPQQMEAFTPTSLDGNFDFNNLNLGQSSYVDSTNQISRSDSIKKSKRDSGSHSNRASLGLVSTPAGYDPTSCVYVSGHVTPESATTSGAATPYTYQYDSRSNQISPNGAYNAMNGRDMGFGGMSRAPTSTNYVTGVLPHIAGQRGGHEMDWHFPSNFNSNDDYGNTQYHSGTNTPIHPIKSEGDLASLPMGEYTYLHSKA